MTMRRIFTLLAVSMSTALVFAQTPKPLSAFEQELVSSEKQFMQAFGDKNVAYVNQAVSDDFKGIGTNGDFVEKGDLVGEAQEGRPKGMRVYDLRVIRLDAGCAVVAYNTITPGARPRYRHVSDTWTKDSGQWKLRFQQTTPNLWSAADLE
jgi:hypothetical protein